MLLEYLDCIPHLHQAQDKLPEEYQNCMTGLKQVLKLNWDIANKSRNNNNDNGQTTTMADDKTRIQALALVNESAFYYNDHNTD
jgi:hypothetical protein